MRVRLTLGEGRDAATFDDVVSAEIVRDLEEISGSFEIQVLDQARMAAARPAWWRPEPRRGAIIPGERVSLALNGTTVLVGWLDKVEIHYGPDKLDMVLAGRDLTGDLVDCAAAPDGPAEYRGLTLTEICAAICKPFGIKVRAEVDVGAPFPLFGLEPAETALSVIEKACRQRAVLALSDGVGGLVLTRGGRTKAPADLVFGRDIHLLDARFDWSQRFSRYLVKGQLGGAKPAAAPADSTANPLSAAPVATPPAERRPAPTSAEGVRPRVVMGAEAKDPAVRRHRPFVTLAKTQSGAASLDTQADWLMRTHRARAEELRVVLPGWHGGEGERRRLWRPNERVTVDDPLAGVSHELLVAGTTWSWGKQGARTELRLCGVDAFDVLKQEEVAQQRRPAAPRLDSTANPLTPEAPRGSR